MSFISDLRIVQSRLAPKSSNRAGAGKLFTITGEELVSMVTGPEGLSVHQLGDILHVPHDSKTHSNTPKNHTREELARLVALIPPPTSKKALRSAFTLLCKGNIYY